MVLNFIHAADFHLDSAFGALTAQQAAERRRESREMVFRLADYVNQNHIELVLLAGDLFDSAAAYRETGEQLAQALGRMNAQVLVAPGNHDWYGPGSPWMSVSWPKNVHIFKDSVLTAVNFPQWDLTVHGAAFTAAEQNRSMLMGFTAPADDDVHFALLHGEVDPSDDRYGPLHKDEIAASGLDYLALGHIHKRGEPFTFGRTLCAWPGCIEGRGFDELGEKGFYQGALEDGNVTLTFVPFAQRRYEILKVDVTGQEPSAAVEAALPEDTHPHLYRIVLTGETGEAGVNLPALRESLAGRFYTVEVQDRTRMAEDIWARSGEETLRGLFLRELRGKWDAASSEEERETITRAARFGLAALDHRDLG